MKDKQSDSQADVPRTSRMKGPDARRDERAWERSVGRAVKAAMRLRNERRRKAGGREKRRDSVRRRLLIEGEKKGKKTRDNGSAREVNWGWHRSFSGV